MGERQNLVLVPGSLCDARVWQGQAGALADVAISTIPSLHGHASLSAMAEAVLAAAPPQFALSGFSMGGRVALEMWRLAPQRITRLALVGASVHPVAAGEADKRAPQIALARQQGMAALSRWWNPRITDPARHGDVALMGLLEDMACGFTPEEYAAEVAALLNRPDPRGLLAGIDVPVLVLAGECDPLSTPERNAAMAAAIAGAQVVSVAGAWHFPMLEKPEAVTAALRDWLAR